MIQNGAVGGGLHILTIPLGGPVKEEWVNPEQYVGEPSPQRDRSSEFMVLPEHAGGESS
jgi:hypothetical protein